MKKNNIISDWLDEHGDAVIDKKVELILNQNKMTPKEKAKELFRKFVAPTQQWDDVDGYITDEYNAKQCALIAVDEILEMDLPILEEDADTFYDYWEEVKHEIKKL